MTAAHFVRQFTQPDMASEFRRNYTDQVVTPELARIWLTSFNTRNRAFKYTSAHTYAKDMKAGKWTQGSRIMFYADGTLCDGQNRLLAVMESNVNVFFDVLVGATFEEGANVDTGSKRSVSDALQIKGAPLWIANIYCVAIVNVINKLATGSSNIRLPHYIIEEFAKKEEDWLRPVIDLAKNATNKKRLTNCAFYAQLAVALRAGVSIAEIVDFSNRYTSGDNYDQSKSSVTKLREYVLSYSGDPWQFPLSVDTAKRTQRALKAFIERQSLMKLYAPDEFIYQLPIVLDPKTLSKLDNSKHNLPKRSLL
jgi:hypothetical protein